MLHAVLRCCAGGVSAGAIVGIVLAALAFVFIVGGVTAMLLSKRREEKKAMEFQRFGQYHRTFVNSLTKNRRTVRQCVMKCTPPQGDTSTASPEPCMLFFCICVCNVLPGVHGRPYPHLWPMCEAPAGVHYRRWEVWFELCSLSLSLSVCPVLLPNRV